MTDSKWDWRFLDLAKTVSLWSLDPSTKTGAVIVDPDRRVVSLGYNGFAKGVKDHENRYADRELKYRMVLHCEVNAILFAPRPLIDCILYTWPFMSCSNCAAVVIQAGIKRCVAPVLPPELSGRWQDSVALSMQQFDESGVVLDLLNPNERV